MKKVFVTVFICLLLISSVFAYIPQESLVCDVKKTLIPENTAYIDMLLPLPEDSTYFCNFNDENGKKYNIDKTSEIVAFCEDGFQSYTFHTEYAKSRISPFLLENPDETFLCIEFLKDESGIDPIGFGDIDIFGKTYKKARFAYIDKDGNVLAVTNDVDIWNGWSMLSLSVSISGTTAESKTPFNPWLLFEFFVLLAFLFIFLLLLFPIILTVFLIVRAIKKRKKNA